MYGIQLLPDDRPEDLAQKALQVRPSPNQLAWHQVGFAAFLHFGVNTYTNREWGDGSESPSIFNPTEFDAEEIVSTLREGGMGLVILTCKHHDGFCLWPSQHTDHSIAHSPYKNGKGDLVREVADACHRQGLRFGVYLSPWDRHDARYGNSPAYNDYYIAQLTELLTQYGEISDVWLDGACAEGPNGKRQEYDWQRIYRTVRALAPNATISGMGPDVRWCGNEAGKCRESEWNVVPVPGTDGLSPEESSVTAAAFTTHNAGVPSLCQQPDLGSREKLAEHAKKSDRLFWYPAQVDLSIRPGWFYHSEEDLSVRSLEQLLEDYILAVGGNAQLLLNLPPDTHGKLGENDTRNVRQLGAVLRHTFANNLLDDATLTAEPSADTAALLQPDGFCAPNEGTTLCVTALFPTEREFDLVELTENIANGQRIEQVTLELLQDGAWKPLSSATVVGSRRLIRLPRSHGNGLRIQVTKSRGTPELCRIGAYLLPEILGGPVISRDEEGTVSLQAKDGASIRYTTDGSAPENGLPYQKPFSLPLGGTVRAKAIYPAELLEDAFVSGTGESSAAFGLLTKGWKVVSTSGGERDGQSLDSLLSPRDGSYVVAETDCYTVDIALDRVYSLTGLLYQPIASDPDFRYNCTGAKVAVRLSEADEWTELPVVFPFDNIYHNPKLMVCPFPEAKDAQFVRVMLGGGLREGFCAVERLGFQGA